MQHWCRYYTPAEIAELVANLIHVKRPRSIIDPAAGNGALLMAAKARYPDAMMFAIDIDPVAAKHLKKEMPLGIVSNCDALSRRSMSRSCIWPHREEIDVVVANPPFGVLGSRRIIDVTCWGHTLRAGVASSHLLSAAFNFSPKQIVAVVPGATTHSERDLAARRLMSKYYTINVNETLSGHSFPGNSASIRVVALTRVEEEGNGSSGDAVTNSEPSEVGPVEVIRGGVAIHAAKATSERRGVPLLHTTMMGGSSKRRQFVRPIGRGLVAGHLVLIPRVGLPQRKHLVPWFLGRHQLSDCVIALRCDSRLVAREVCELIERRFEDFRSLWGGTGAQYTTIAKIVRFLGELGIACRVGGCDSRFPE